MGKLIDLTGQKFGRLTVIERDRSKKEVMWICQCDCGNTKSIRSYDLRSGKTQSCGCLRNERVREAIGIDLTGQRIGMITVIRRTNNVEQGCGQSRTAWLCKCDCGQYFVSTTRDLRAGDVYSCGCWNKRKSREQKLKDLTGQRFGKLVVIELDEEYMDNYRKENDTHAYWKCKCDCGNIKTTSSQCLLNGSTKSCGCIKSSGEVEIENWLRENNLNYIRQYGFSDLKDINQLKFDFAIFQDTNLKCLIEYNGKQHYEPVDFFGGEESFKSQQKKDKMKEEYCKQHNIPLIIYCYDEDIDFNKIKVYLKGEK